MTPLPDLEQRFNLPAGLLAAVERAESGGDPRAVSPAGALGRFQFMPATARELGVDPMDPEQAAHGAARYLRQLLDRFGGSLPHALAAYNWGMGNVERQGLGQMPAETRRYLTTVTQRLLGEDQAQPQYVSGPAEAAAHALPGDLPAVAQQNLLAKAQMPGQLDGASAQAPGSPDADTFDQFVGDMLGAPSRQGLAAVRLAEGGLVQKAAPQGLTRETIDARLRQDPRFSYQHTPAHRADQLASKRRRAGSTEFMTSMFADPTLLMLGPANKGRYVLGALAATHAPETAAGEMMVSEAERAETTAEAYEQALRLQSLDPDVDPEAVLERARQLDRAATLRKLERLLTHQADVKRELSRQGLMNPRLAGRARRGATEDL